MGRAYLIVSGKGGTGKTTVATSLALALADRGRNVLLLDGDVGLRCCDLLMGMENLIVYDAGDVMEKRCTLTDAVVMHPVKKRLHLLSAPQMMSPGDVSKKAMNILIGEAKTQYDYVLIDCPAGIGRGLKNLWQNADDALVVVTPDDASVRAAERVNDLLFERRQLHGMLLLNRVDRLLIRMREEKRPADIAAQLDLSLIGILPESYDVYRAILSHKSAYDCDSVTVRRAVRRIAARLDGRTVRFPRTYHITTEVNHG